MRSIEDYQKCGEITSVFLAPQKFLGSFTKQEILNLVDLGLDYVLFGTRWENETLCKFQLEMAHVRQKMISQVVEAVGNTCPLTVIQSNATAMQDRRIQLNGYKADIDFQSERTHLPVIVSCLRNAGISKKGIDENFLSIVDISDEEDIDFTDDKTFLGSIFVPFEMEGRTQQEKFLIERVANKHFPVVKLVSEGCGFLIGVDVTFAYLGQECRIDTEFSMIDGCRVQNFEHNFAVAIVRYRLFIHFGILKPNSILLMAYMMAKEFDEVKLLKFLEDFGVEDFTAQLLSFYSNYLSSSSRALFRALEQKYGCKLSVVFGNQICDLHESFEELLSQNAS